MTQTQDDLVAMDGAGGEFEVLADDGEAAAQRIAEAFAEAGQVISTVFLEAAETGRFNFSEMVESILQDLARIALELAILEPLNALAQRLGEGVGASIGDVLGQRQAGGPVLAGAPYLVGEQGPEVFIPHSSGHVMASGPSQVVNITIQAQGETASAIRRSERQITAAVARAAAAGGRLL